MRKSAKTKIDFKIGKRYKWNPYVSGTNLWKNGILSFIENKTYPDGSTQRIGHFVTFGDEEWAIPLDTEDSNIREF